MKAVIDEGVPRDLVKLLREQGCDISAFPNKWKGTKNGKLLALVREAGFHTLLTSDRNFRHQQTIGASGVALVVLPAQTLADLLPIAQAIASARQGEATIMSQSR